MYNKQKELIAILNIPDYLSRFSNGSFFSRLLFSRLLFRSSFGRDFLDQTLSSLLLLFLSTGVLLVEIITTVGEGTNQDDVTENTASLTTYKSNIVSKSYT